MSDSKAETRRLIFAKFPLELGTLAGFAFLLLMSLGNLLREEPAGTRLYANAAFACCCLIALFYLFLRRVKGRAELALFPGTVEVNGMALDPGAIGQIRIHGRIVGIVPAGRRIAPVRLCLDIPDARDRNTLVVWAAQHDIVIRKGRFFKWI